MAGTPLIEAGDYVDIGGYFMGDKSERYVVLADGLSPTQVYISPVNNLSVKSLLVYINGEWKVKDAESINYKIIFSKGVPSSGSVQVSPTYVSVSPTFQPAFQPTFQPTTFQPTFQPAALDDTTASGFAAASGEPEFEAEPGPVYRPGVPTLSHKLEHLQDGMCINVSNMNSQGIGARIIRKSDQSRLTQCQGINIVSFTLEKYELALKFLIKDGYLTPQRAVYYYEQFMETIGDLTPEQEAYNLEQFKKSIGFATMVKSARKR